MTEATARVHALLRRAAAEARRFRVWFADILERPEVRRAVAEGRAVWDTSRRWAARLASSRQTQRPAAVLGVVVAASMFQVLLSWAGDVRGALGVVAGGSALPAVAGECLMPGPTLEGAVFLDGCGGDAARLTELVTASAASPVIDATGAEESTDAPAEVLAGNAVAAPSEEQGGRAASGGAGGSPVLVAAALPSAAAPAPEARSAAGDGLERRFAAALFEAINEARASRGLAPFVADGSLRAASAQYARLLVAGGTLDHHLDGEPWDRARRAGYGSGVVGEVLALFATTGELDASEHAAVMMEAWMNSPPHRDAILSRDFPFSETGAGCAIGVDGAGRSLVICAALVGAP